MLTRDPYRARRAVERDPAPAEGIEYVRPPEAAITNARLELERTKRRLNDAERARLARKREAAGHGRRAAFWLAFALVLFGLWAYASLQAWRAGDCVIRLAHARAESADPDLTPGAHARRVDPCSEGER